MEVISIPNMYSNSTEFLLVLSHQHITYSLIPANLESPPPPVSDSYSTLSIYNSQQGGSTYLNAVGASRIASKIPTEIVDTKTWNINTLCKYDVKYVYINNLV